MTRSLQGRQRSPACASISRVSAPSVTLAGSVICAPVKPQTGPRVAKHMQRARLTMTFHKGSTLRKHLPLHRSPWGQCLYLAAFALSLRQHHLGWPRKWSPCCQRMLGIPERPLRPPQVYLSDWAPFWTFVRAKMPPSAKVCAFCAVR